MTLQHVLLILAAVALCCLGVAVFWALNLPLLDDE